MISKRKTEVFIGLGSNLGNRKENLVRAVREMGLYPISIKKISSIYETSPVGPGQRNFLNSVLKGETPLPPRSLLQVLKTIERKMGREKTARWGPRKIDLDILFYGRKKLQTRVLKIPHPQFSKRKFVLRPLVEIAPLYKPAGFSKTVLRLARELTDPNQKVRLFSRFPSI